jgi:hypothetical protein
MTRDHAVAAKLHDALWAVLWNRHHSDVDEPLWLPDSAYLGMVAYTHDLGDGLSAGALDTAEAFVAFRVQGPVPPVGSRARVIPAGRELWKFADVAPLGLGVELRFDVKESAQGDDAGWLATLRGGVVKLRTIFDQRRELLAARRAELGALQEPSTLEAIWREQVAGITDRVALDTDFTPQEHAALARARAKGPRTADEEERRVQAARKKRYSERAAVEVAEFREQRWPAIRDAALAEMQRYVDYRTEVVRLEDALQRIRALTERGGKAGAMLDQIARAHFRVGGLTVDESRLEEATYAEEVLRSVELLYMAIPQRAAATATSFSAYRAPTAGPSVIPPRY